MRLEYFEMIDRVPAFDREGRKLTAEATVPLESRSSRAISPGIRWCRGPPDRDDGPGLRLPAAGAERPVAHAIPDGRRRGTLPAVRHAGQRLSIEAIFDQEGSGYAATKAKIRVEGKLVASASLRFALTAFPADMATLMRSQIARIGLGSEIPA